MVKDESFVDCFWNNKQVVFSYAAADVMKLLEGRELAILQELRSYLKTIAVASFPELREKTLVNRRKANTLAHDIFYLGYSIVNDSVCTELDIIFVKEGEGSHSQNKSTVDDRMPGDISPSEFARLLQMVTELKRSLYVLENKHKQLK